MKFKTNINCGNCLAKVKPFLDAKKGIESFEVNFESDDRILTVESPILSAQEIINTIAKAGFKAEAV